jgi:rubrerythrin
MIKLYVCKICGEPYLGSEADDCAFCGAPKNYLKMIEEYSELWEVELSEQEKKDMKETLDLEINATAYYNKVSESGEDYSKQNLLFKQLARVEAEHAEVAAKFLNIKRPQFKGEDPKGSLKKDLERTKNLEQGAIEKYQKFLKNAKDNNVKNFYVALIHAEKGHHEIASEELEKV